MNFEGETPSYEIMPLPEHLDEDTLIFVLEHLAQLAMDFGLEPMQRSIDIKVPGSIDNFIKELEKTISASARESEEKDAALKVLTGLIDYYKGVLDSVRRLDA